MNFVIYSLIFLFFLLLLKVISNRFINPLHFTLISFLYYSIPIIFVICFIDPDISRISYSRDNLIIAKYCLFVIIISIVAIFSGFYIVNKIKIRNNYYIKVTENKFLGLKFFYYFFFILISIGILLYGPSIIFSGYNMQSDNNNASLGTALLFGSLEYFGILFSFTFIYKIMYGVIPLKKFFLFSIIILFILAIARGKRLEIFSALIPIIILNFAYSNFFKKRLHKFLLSVVIIILISLIAIFRTGGQFSINGVLYNFISEGLLAGMMLPSVMNLYISNQMFYEFGSRILVSFLSIVPSLVWINKNEYIIKFSQNFEGLTPFGAVSYLSEVFVQGGFIFLFFYFFIFGAFIAYIYKIKNHIDQDMKDKKISLQLILYLNYLTFSVPHFRDGIIVSNKSFIQATIFFLILLYINRKQFKKNESINYNCD
jgi:hypothetical protein